MTLLPDLRSLSIESVAFFFHLPGGLKGLDRFLRERGLGREKEALGTAFMRYRKRNKTHTASIQWRTAGHTGCADLRIDLDATTPKRLGFSATEVRLNQQLMLELLEFLHDRKAMGPHVRFGLLLPPAVAPTKLFGTSLRVRALELEVGEGDDTSATLRRVTDGWRLTLEFTDLFSLADFPVGQEAFARSIEFASGVAVPLKEMIQLNG